MILYCEFLFYSIPLWYYIFFATTISHHTVCNMPRGHWYKIYTWTILYLVFALRSLIHQSICVAAGGARPGQSFEEVNAHWASHDWWRRRWDWLIDFHGTGLTMNILFGCHGKCEGFKNNISFSTSLALRLCLWGVCVCDKKYHQKKGQSRQWWRPTWPWERIVKKAPLRTWNAWLGLPAPIFQGFYMLILWRASHP